MSIPFGRYIILAKQDYFEDYRLNKNAKEYMVENIHKTFLHIVRLSKQQLQDKKMLTPKQVQAGISILISETPLYIDMINEVKEWGENALHDYNSKEKRLEYPVHVSISKIKKFIKEIFDTKVTMQAAVMLAGIMEGFIVIYLARGSEEARLKQRKTITLHDISGD